MYSEYMDYIAECEAYLKSKITDPYRVAHSFRVANIGKKIAEEEGMNEQDLIIACLLHDISYCENFKAQEEWLNHGRKSAQMVREFLKSIHYPQQRIQDICFAIAIHVDLKADFQGEYTPFTQSVQEADNIDRVGAYRLYETLESVKFSAQDINVQAEYVESMLKTLNEYLTYDCSTKTATKLWKDRIQFQIDFYMRLKEQMKISTSI